MRKKYTRSLAADSDMQKCGLHERLCTPSPGCEAVLEENYRNIQPSRVVVEGIGYKSSCVPYLHAIAMWLGR